MGAKVTSPFRVFAVHVQAALTSIFWGSEMSGLRSMDAGRSVVQVANTRSFARMLFNVISPVPKATVMELSFPIGGI